MSNILLFFKRAAPASLAGSSRSRKRLPSRLCAAAIYAALVVLAAAPAPAQSLATDKSLYCFGDTVYVTLTCTPGSNPKAYVGESEVPLTPTESGTYVGQIVVAPGEPWVTASDDASDYFPEFQISVVKLCGIVVAGNPMYSGWFKDYPGSGDNLGSGDCAALAYGCPGDQVVLAADVVPYTDTAATKISWWWNGYENYAEGTLLHGVDAYTVAKTDVTAYACGDTFHYNVWVFWVTNMSLKVSGSLDGDDALRFNTPAQKWIFPAPAYGGPQPDESGPWVGMASMRQPPLLPISCYGGWSRVEVTGTLGPAGVGAFLAAHGEGFTFGPQYVTWSGWDYAGDTTPTDKTTWSDGQVPDEGGASPLCTSQAVNDKLFFLDTPGPDRDASRFADNHYLGLAQNFETYAYVLGPLGPAQASDPYYWYNRVKVQGNGSGGANAVTPPPGGVKAGEGSPDLPANWSDNAHWNP
jgi:hypothetical protein